MKAGFTLRALAARIEMLTGRAGKALAVGVAAPVGIVAGIGVDDDGRHAVRRRGRRGAGGHDVLDALAEKYHALVVFLLPFQKAARTGKT